MQEVTTWPKEPKATTQDVKGDRESEIKGKKIPLTTSDEAVFRIPMMDHASEEWKKRKETEELDEQIEEYDYLVDLIHIEELLILETKLGLSGNSSIALTVTTIQDPAFEVPFIVLIFLGIYGKWQLDMILKDR